MSRRAAVATLALLPLLALTSCADTDRPGPGPASTSAETVPAASPTISFVEREWLLSSPQQRQRYCKDFLSDDIHTVRYFNFSEDDTGRDALEEILAFLKTKC